MTTTVDSSKPDYFKPYRKTQFSQKPDEYKTDNSQRLWNGKIEKFGKDYNFESSLNRDSNNGFTNIKFKDELGLVQEKTWQINGDCVEIKKNFKKIFIVDKKTGLKRQITNQEKEKIIKLGIKLEDDYIDFIRKLENALCGKDEKIEELSESIYKQKRGNAKWEIVRYIFDDFKISNYRSKQTINAIIGCVPEQTELINPKIREMLINYAQNLLRHLK